MLSWAIILVAATGAGHATAVACPVTGGRTLLQSASVRVYRTKNDEVRACRKGGRNVLLANANDELAFLPPAMAINGDRVAYGQYFNDIDDLSATTVNVEDLRQGQARRARSHPATSFYERARVVRTSLQTNGTVVWSACASDAPPAIAPFKARRCPTGPGDGTHAVAQIRVGYANGRTRTLDSSNVIDPRSIRVRDGRISWKRGSGTRSFRLG